MFLIIAIVLLFFFVVSIWIIQVIGGAIAPPILFYYQSYFLFVSAIGFDTIYSDDKSGTLVVTKICVGIPC